MILGYSNDKFNKSTKIRAKCDKCNNNFTLYYIYYIHHRKLKHPDNNDYCSSCWKTMFHNSKEYKEKMSISVKKAYKNDPTIRTRISKSMQGKIDGDKNPMKDPKTREKTSKSRKKRLSDPVMRKQLSTLMVKAWKKGLFDNVKVGRCKWYTYTDFNGNTHKLQGTYELKFAAWMSEHKIKFVSHTGTLSYIDSENNKRFYYPDFYVEQWKSIVEIKSDYYKELSKDKMKLIIEQNPEQNILIIANKELTKLGIKL